MSFSDPSSANLLAACGGDTVKLFDVTVDSGDPCALSYTPTPGSLLNCVKWNHTNQVVASAGDDKKISLFRKNGKIICTLPLSRSDMGDAIDECISTISFSNRGSRYLCSGGSGKTVRIWDLQRKLCIKRLSGHRDTITGVMYNCKDEYLASISLKGDLILHNLTSGARAAELKDPNGQVLRVLDYSRLSRHILVTAGDDGSVHLWDTTGRNPKASWLKQHSAPTTGVCFSPSSDKMIATVGLDKKLYTFDSASKRPTFCAPYEAPFASLVFRDDGNIMAAGTNTGRVVFYDVRGKPQPFTVLRAYNSSEAVTSLCWQRSKPVTVNADNCSDDIALLGGTGGDDSILMPDPLPSAFSSTATTLSRSSPTVTTSGLLSIAQISSEETPLRASLWGGGALSRLHAPRGSYNFKDDMDVFSPLVDVQPITPSLGNMWDEQYDTKKENLLNDNKSILSSTIRKFPLLEANFDPPILDCKSNTISTQDGASHLNVTPLAASKGESSASTTPPEAWGGTSYTDRQDSHCESMPSLSLVLPNRSVSSGSTFAGLQDDSGQTNYFMKNSLTSPSLSLTNIQSRVAASREVPSGVSESSATLLAAKTAGLTNFELPATISPIASRRFSTYAERIGITASFSEGMNSTLSSPKPKKLGTESREELTNVLCRQDSSGSMGNGSMPSMNGSVPETRVTDPQQAVSSFSLQLIQRTLEGTLGSVQDAIHADVRNLHIELLRQFHMQEMEMSGLLNTALEKIDDLRKEVQSLKSDNKQLRQLLGLQ